MKRILLNQNKVMVKLYFNKASKKLYNIYLGLTQRIYGNLQDFFLNVNFFKDHNKNIIKVAICAVAKYEDYYLEEWLDYNYKLGFDHIFLFQNDWRTNLERPFLTKKIWDGKSIQLKVYNNFLKNNTEYDWIALIDCDEFIVLKKHNNIQTFIEEFKEKTNVIALNWYMYGSLGLEKRQGNSLIKMFKMRDEQPNHHIKVIANKCVNKKSGPIMDLPHNTTKKSMDTNGKFFNGPYNPDGPTDIAYINHYYYKTKEDWDLRCIRGRVDCEIPHNMNIWEDEKNTKNNMEDLSAYNFMYGDL